MTDSKFLAIGHIHPHPIDKLTFRNRGSILLPEPALQLYDVLRKVIPGWNQSHNLDYHETIDQIREINFSLERTALIVEYFFKGTDGPKLHKNPTEPDFDPKKHIQDNLYHTYNDPQTQYLIYKLTTNPEEFNRCILAIRDTESDSDGEKSFAEKLQENYKIHNDTHAAVFGKTMFGHYHTAYLIIKHLESKFGSSNSENGSIVATAIGDINSLVTTAIEAGADNYLKRGIANYTYSEGMSYTQDDLGNLSARLKTRTGPTISGGKSRKRKTKKHTKKQSRKRKTKKHIKKTIKNKVKKNKKKKIIL